jgi:hypothetical protein
MAIQSVIQVAELILIPTRPSPHDLRAVGATVDLCERAGKPLIFVVNAATPKAKITDEAAIALSQHGTVAPVTLHHRTDFAASMIDGRTVMEVDPKGRSAKEVEDLWEYVSDRLEKNFRRTVFSAPGVPTGSSALLPSDRWLRPPGGWPVSGGLSMNEPKPFASSPQGCWPARECKACDAPQGFAQVNGNGNLEDLGWNDMGHGSAPAMLRARKRREHVPSSIAALTPAPKLSDPAGANGMPVPFEQQRAIEETFTPASAQAEAYERASRLLRTGRAGAIAEIVPMPPRPRRAPGLKEKAAFTLRLDSERHLKLRLACAVKHRSAQQIVSQALDEFLESLPELDAMTRQLPSRSAAKN